MGRPADRQSTALPEAHGRRGRLLWECPGEALSSPGAGPRPRSHAAPAAPPPATCTRAGPLGSPPSCSTARPRCLSPRHRKDSDSLRKACILVATRQQALGQSWGRPSRAGAGQAEGWAGLWLRPQVGFPEFLPTGKLACQGRGATRSHGPSSRAPEPLRAAVGGCGCRHAVRTKAQSHFFICASCEQDGGGSSDRAVFFTPSWGRGAGADAAPPPAAQAGGNVASAPCSPGPRDVMRPLPARPRG